MFYVSFVLNSKKCEFVTKTYFHSRILFLFNKTVSFLNFISIQQLFSSCVAACKSSDRFITAKKSRRIAAHILTDSDWIGNFTTIEPKSLIKLKRCLTESMLQSRSVATEYLSSNPCLVENQQYSLQHYINIWFSNLWTLRKFWRVR